MKRWSIYGRGTKWYLKITSFGLNQRKNGARNFRWSICSFHILMIIWLCLFSSAAEYYEIKRLTHMEISVGKQNMILLLFWHQWGLITIQITELQKMQLKKTVWGESLRFPTYLSNIHTPLLSGQWHQGYRSMEAGKSHEKRRMESIRIPFKNV